MDTLRQSTISLIPTTMDTLQKLCDYLILGSVDTLQESRDCPIFRLNGHHARIKQPPNSEVGGHPTRIGQLPNSSGVDDQGNSGSYLIPTIGDSWRKSSNRPILDNPILDTDDPWLESNSHLIFPNHN
jgi:hypothetical protein